MYEFIWIKDEFSFQHNNKHLAGSTFLFQESASDYSFWAKSEAERARPEIQFSERGCSTRPLVSPRWRATVRGRAASAVAERSRWACWPVGLVTVWACNETVLKTTLKSVNRERHLKQGWLLAFKNKIHTLYITRRAHFRDKPLFQTTKQHLNNS